MKSKQPILLAVSLAALGLCHSVSAAVSLSYDFGSDPGKDDLSDFTTTGTWTLQPDAASFSKTGSFGTRQALTQVTELGNSQSVDFTIQSVFTPTAGSYSQDFERIGIVALADSGTSDTTGIAAVLHRNSGNQPILLLRSGINGSAIVSQAWTGTFAASTTYTAQLTGTYSGSDLNLAFTLTDPSNHSQTLNHTVALAGADGQFFGLGGRGGTFGADFDTFSVVPEPSMALLGGLGVLGLLRRRR